MAKSLTLREKIAQARAHGGDALGIAHDPVLQMAAIDAAGGRFAQSAEREDFERWLGATEAGSSLGAVKAEGWYDNLHGLQDATAQTSLAEFRPRVLRLLEGSSRASLFEAVSASLSLTIQGLAGPPAQYEAVITALTFEDARKDDALPDESTNTPLDSWPYGMRLRTG